MEHPGTQRIETDRLILRPFAVTDAGAMFRNWAHDPEVTKYLTWPPHADLSVTEALLRVWVERYQQPDNYNWVLALRENDEAIGSLAVVSIREHGPVRAATLGYCMGRAWWGRGLMPEAGRAVLAYLFDRAGFTKVNAQHDVNNPKSGRVMEKMGMTRVGIFRREGVNNQGLSDVVWYEMLADDPRP